MLPAAYATPAAVVLAVGGLLACFAGFRLFRLVLGLYGGLIGAVVTIGMMESPGAWTLMVAAVVGGLVGAMLAIAAYFVGVGLVGAGLTALGLIALWRWFGTDPPTVVLVVGRGSSDPDANSDVYKLARILWEGSGLLSVETCFIGITHPRMPEGLERCMLLQPQRIIVLPYLLFTGVLVKRIAGMARDFGEAHAEVEVLLTDDIGELPVFMDLLFEREREAVAGMVAMNCDACKWRRAGIAQDHGHSPAQAEAHDHGHTHDPGHPHSHGHAHDHQQPQDRDEIVRKHDCVATDNSPGNRRHPHGNVLQEAGVLDY